MNLGYPRNGTDLCEVGEEELADERGHAQQREAVSHVEHCARKQEGNDRVDLRQQCYQQNGRFVWV